MQIKFEVTEENRIIYQSSYCHFSSRYTMSDLRKDMIYQQAFQAAKVSYVVNMVSTSYVQVSQKHVMSRIAGQS